jgi:hypothetical protein
MKVEMEISKNANRVSRETVGFSVAIIIIMLTSVVVIACICIAKYKGLENYASRLLITERQKIRESSRN